MADIVESPLERLPSEMFLNIVEDPCLSTKDLAAFALTNPHYARLVNPVLYKKNIKEENASAFLWAVIREKTGTMDRLVDNGADINSVEASTHLNQSSPYRWTKRLRLSFLASNVWREYSEANVQDIKYRYTPLALAARHGLATAVRWLLEKGANPEVPAWHLCDCGNRRQMWFGMWPMGPPARPIEPSQWTALHLAVQFGYKDIVQLLLDHGANTRQVCCPEDGRCSILHTAFDCMKESIIESLMDRFAGTDMIDINARSQGGITPLHIAYCCRSSRLVDLALRFGANINLEYEIDQNKWTLFAMACAASDWGFALKLLELGASPYFDIQRSFPFIQERWTTDYFRRDLMRRYSLGHEPDARALLDELNRIARDREIANALSAEFGGLDL